MRFQILICAAFVALSCSIHQPKGIHNTTKPEFKESLPSPFKLKRNRDVQEMNAVQLQLEKSDLEVFLKKNPSDSAIIEALIDPTLKAIDFTSPIYARSDNDFGPTGKLKRYSKSETLGRNLAKAIRQSPNFAVFHQHRLISLQLQRRLKSDSLALPISDTLWTGSYRANAEILFANPEKFLILEACQAWGKNISVPFRDTAFTFSFECEQNGRVHIQKLW